jgi:predicted ATPase/DNA-binding winged helix-turn-helix (wHTH) protein
MNANLDDARALAGQETLGFGPFQLDRVRRVLMRDGRPLRVGSRALDILITLAERPGSIVSKSELLTRVWPNCIVEEGTLRVHVALLRKILREAGIRTDYVQNVTGRGYRLAASVSRQRNSALSDAAHSSNGTVLTLPVRHSSPVNNLPQLLAPVFGRAQTIQTLAGSVPRQRFVTITGPSGGGKTTVAVRVAEILASDYPQEVCFVDLGSVTEPGLVSGALASALGLAAVGADPLPEILSFLSAKSLLLVLDNCEHVLEGAAKLAEAVLRSTRDVHVLATSLEPMRAVGESIHRLACLEVPPAQHRAHLLEFPAIELFVDRARMYSDTELDESELPLAADICRWLEGNPLAIEIMAAQVSLLGVKALAAGQQDDVYLSSEGRRTAVPRQRTLRAMLDWSYALLSPTEQSVLRRLSVFAGSFDLECATVLLADGSQNAAAVFECLAHLARNSLLLSDATGEKLLYRLPELHRAFACEKLRQSDDLAAIARAHVHRECASGQQEHTHVVA